MTTRKVAELKSAISEHWKNVPAGEAALLIIGEIEAQATPATEWRMADILGLLGASAATPAGIAALGILTQSEYAIFLPCADFVDEANQRHRLSSEDFHRVLVEDTVLHPVTEVEVARASERVVPVFVLDPSVTW